MPKIVNFSGVWEAAARADTLLAAEIVVQGPHGVVGQVGPQAAETLAQTGGSGETFYGFADVLAITKDQAAVAITAQAAVARPSNGQYVASGRLLESRDRGHTWRTVPGTEVRYDRQA